MFNRLAKTFFTDRYPRILGRCRMAHFGFYVDLFSSVLTDSLPGTKPDHMANIV